jgi:hypothetical protein
MDRGRTAIATAIVMAAGLLASPVSADAGAEERARQHFKNGVTFLQDPEGERFEEAYNEFKASYDLVPAAKVLGNLGLCAMKLERDGEAIDDYTRYLAEVPDIDPEERAQIVRDVAVLQSAARVSIEVHEPGAKLRDRRIPVRGADVVNVYEARVGTNAYRIRPGRHVMVLEVGGRDHGQWEVTVPPSGTLTHDFLPPPEPPAPPPSIEKAPRTAPLVVMGVGAATLIGASIVGIVALGKIGDLEEKCPGNTCHPRSFEADVDDTRGVVRTADILFVAGGLVTAIGLGWYLLSPSTLPTRATSACTARGCFGGLAITFR